MGFCLVFFGLRVSGLSLRFWFEGFGIWPRVLGLVLWDLALGFGFGFRVSEFGLGLGFWDLAMGFGFRVLGFGLGFGV